MPRGWIIAPKWEAYLSAVANGAMQQKGGPAQRGPSVRRETMKILIRAAFAALSFASIGSAIAGEGEGTIANTRFTELPGMVAEAPAQNAPAVATAQNGQAVQAYVTKSSR